MAQTRDAGQVAASMEQMVQGLEAFLQNRSVNNADGKEIFPRMTYMPLLEGYFAVFLNDVKMARVLEWLRLNGFVGPATALDVAYREFWHCVKSFDRCADNYNEKSGSIVIEQQRPKVISAVNRLLRVLRECVKHIRETFGVDNRTLIPCQKAAYASYELAIQKNPQLADATDKKVHEWLRDHCPVEEYDPPEYKTWSRYVRAGRKYHDKRKNNPRAGRSTGSSIVTPKQI